MLNFFQSQTRFIVTSNNFRSFHSSSFVASLPTFANLPGIPPFESSENVPPSKPEAPRTKRISSITESEPYYFAPHHKRSHQPIFSALVHLKSGLPPPPPASTLDPEGVWGVSGHSSTIHLPVVWTLSCPGIFKKWTEKKQENPSYYFPKCILQTDIFFI